MATLNTNAAPAPLSPIKGLAVLAGVIVAVAAFIGLSLALGLPSFFGGFLFVLYWLTFCHAAPGAFLPGLIGALGGLAMAFALKELPALYGTAGGAAALIVLLAAIYAMIMRWAALIVNPAFMLYLTVATIPLLQDRTTMLQMTLSLLLAGAVMGAVLLVVRLRR